jgi:hypothetical protein
MRTGLLAALAVAGVTASSHGWGPHGQITQAALDALGTNDLVIRHLGWQAERLTNYAWMADYRRLPFEEPGEFFYADDYLIFPDAPVHWDHICPEVKKTYTPYFRRAIQALRTETARNAARWIGSLLHFTEDTGSPPHAAEIRGSVHSKMENWVNAKLIRIPGYRPRLLGTNDDQALDGFLKRMDELIVFSKERANRIKLQVEIGHRAAVEPVVLESALETSRVVADLLHTLGEVALRQDSSGGTVKGIVESADPAGMELFPAKVLLGTNYSTLADLAGGFEFRNVPPGEYWVIAFRSGSGRAEKRIQMAEGKTNGCSLVLPFKGNLVRNGDFSLRWVNHESADCWSFFQGMMQGEVIPLKIGQQDRLTAHFKKDASGEVQMRWTRQLPHAVSRVGPVPMFKTRKLTPEENVHEFTASENFGLLQVSVKGTRKPQGLLEQIQLVPVSGE